MIIVYIGKFTGPRQLVRIEDLTCTINAEVGETKVITSDKTVERPHIRQSRSHPGLSVSGRSSRVNNPPGTSIRFVPTIDCSLFL